MIPILYIAMNILFGVEISSDIFIFWPCSASFVMKWAVLVVKAQYHELVSPRIDTSIIVNLSHRGQRNESDSAVQEPIGV